MAPEHVERVEFATVHGIAARCLREQNLGDADPTYPSQTTVAAKYRYNKFASLFFTERLAVGSSAR